MHKPRSSDIKAGKLGHYVDDLVSENSSYYQRWLIAEGDVSNANLIRSKDTDAQISARNSETAA
ncbi:MULTISPECIES: hypothetical protein [Rhizobium]|uniref:Uncharacterized protein n=1 Tax=Rhizobium aouanii TaxID=3118145 RepID=A0ABU8CLF6_9HYPH|nr:hypothetical protein [Rhizobium acaciae]MCW1410883.1 hypothetical protein [Rhizobium acaciae]MCW1742818.1 hypothetical protein [Rhizobium acaciae]MCW1750015.1 hypothetical protein [Rhizobium acaciae]